MQGLSDPCINKQEERLLTLPVVDGIRIARIALCAAVLKDLPISVEHIIKGGDNCAIYCFTFDQVFGRYRPGPARN